MVVPFLVDLQEYFVYFDKVITTFSVLNILNIYFHSIHTVIYLTEAVNSHMYFLFTFLPYS